jgi:hypothetical protein
MEIKIYKTTSSEDLRNALSGFGRFSSIEIDKEKDIDGKGNVLIFREVGFFKGLRQLIFESKENLEEKIKKIAIIYIIFQKKDRKFKNYLAVQY